MIKAHCEHRFWCKETPVEVIKEGAFGRTYFRDIYSAYKGKQYRKTSFDELKNIGQTCYCSNYYDASVNKNGATCETSLGFGKNKD